MKYNEITHWSHPQHKVRLNYTNIPFKCNGCKEIGIGSHYNCSSSSCDFDLHTDCAIPKASIGHPFYTDCSFQFLPQPPGLIERNCNACQKRVTGFLYHCRKCGFDLHPCCARLPMVLHDQGRKVKFNLFEKVSSKCQHCGKKGQSWSYRSTCNRYSLHVACVKEMILERWHENEYQITRVLPLSFKETLPPRIDYDYDYDDDDDDNKKKGKRKKVKIKCSEMAGIAFQFIVSAILGDPTALIAGVFATLVSKS